MPLRPANNQLVATVPLHPTPISLVGMTQPIELAFLGSKINTTLYNFAMHHLCRIIASYIG